MPYNELLIISAVSTFCVMINWLQGFCNSYKDDIKKEPLLRSREDILESEVARLQTENARLAQENAKKEYR